MTVCPYCGGRLKQIAVIKDKAAAKTFLEKLKETTIFNPLEEIWEKDPPMFSELQDEFD